MIKKLILKNFKGVENQIYEFSDFDLLVGSNNSGKSTVLQAIAIWGFCVEVFRQSDRSGVTGTRVLLPNFTALPLPEFNLLWHERTERKGVKVMKDDKQANATERIEIEIGIEWEAGDAIRREFAVNLRYETPQSVYAIPKPGWEAFRTLEQAKQLLKVVYVPPFSGLETSEKWQDTGVIQEEVGKAQPGRVLRNLLLRVWKHQETDGDQTIQSHPINDSDWRELTGVVKRWFGVDLSEPQYPKGATRIICEYKQASRRINEVDSKKKRSKTVATKKYDLISGGSGFQQTLILLAFFYGFHPDVILMDEPDAHLHVSLQKEVLEYFQKVARDRRVQFIVATHSRDFINQVAPHQILSLREGQPQRLHLNYEVHDTLDQLGALDNTQLGILSAYRRLLLVENESDWKLLAIWLDTVLGPNVASQLKRRLAVCYAHGSVWKADVEKLRQQLQRMLKLQGDSLQIFAISDRDYYPDRVMLMQNKTKGHVTFHMWDRVEIENYLLVADATIRLLNQVDNSLTLQEPALRTEFQRLLQDQLGKEAAQDKAVTTQTDFSREKKLGWDPSTCSQKARTLIQGSWGDGTLFSDAKEFVLPAIKRWLKNAHLNEFADQKLAAEIRRSELPQEMINVCEQLAVFVGVPVRNNP
jgi:energy-coupling factor transporter ATP-binding protein EcfA2